MSPVPCRGLGRNAYFVSHEENCVASKGVGGDALRAFADLDSAHEEALLHEMLFSRLERREDLDIHLVEGTVVSKEGHILDHLELLLLRLLLADEVDFGDIEGRGVPNHGADVLSLADIVDE